MALAKEKFREMVFQLLFSLDFHPTIDPELVELLMQELKVTRRATREAEARATTIFSRLHEIDPQLESAAADSYAFSRISRAEKCALRLGAFELRLDSASIPPKVAIAEAIRLARKFGSPEGAHFVNAILDKIYHPHKSREVQSPCEVETASEAIPEN
jgi:N utilization substance protein B